MNGPKRLLDSQSGHLRELVEAGRRDLPGRHIQENVLGALGLDSAGGAGLIAGPSNGLARSVTGRSLHGLSRATLFKVGMAVMVTTTALSAVYLDGKVYEHATRVSLGSTTPAVGSVSPPSSALDPDTTNRRLLGTAAATRPASPPLAAPLVLRLRVRELNARAGSAPATRARHARHDALQADEKHETTIAPSTVDQLDSIRRVHALVAAGDAGAALLGLDAYDARWPHGSFEEEAITLRVRALRAAGDAAGAETARGLLQSRFPRSVYLPTLGK